METRAKRRPPSRHESLTIVLLLFAFCFLVIITGTTDLYDLVRDCIIAILVVYLGWRHVSSRDDTYP